LSLHSYYDQKVAASLLLDEYWYDNPEKAKGARAKLLAGLG
jgi:hypothetical protein